jgi:hypothetical protein
MPVPADNEMVVHGDAERFCHFNERRVISTPACDGICIRL